MGKEQFGSKTQDVKLNSKRQNYDISQEKEQCTKNIIKKVYNLLDTYNISVPFDDIENLRTFTEGKAGRRGKLSGLHVDFILNMKQMYPEYGDEEFKKVYNISYKTDQPEDPLFLNEIENYTIDSMKLTFKVNNIVPSNISLIQITMDVNFVQAESEKMYGFADKTGNKTKWRRKKLKLKKFSTISIFVGTALTLLSSILCGLSFVLKKWSLKKMECGKLYYLDKNWCFGQLIMVIGDILHFMAFYFAPAIIVCTLQMLTVIVTAVASSTILGEKLHKYGKLAFALSVTGCWVIVFHVPNEPYVYSIETLLCMFLDHVFLFYVAILSIITASLVCFFIPKYGKINSLPYVLQSAILGSIVVLGLKGIILGFTDTLFHWLPWISLAVVLVLLRVHLEYLNKALSMYNTLVVTTQYYALYSSFVIFASSLLFKVWVTSSYETIVANFCGYSTVGLGTLILTIFEEENATFNFSRFFAGPEKRTVKKK